MSDLGILLQPLRPRPSASDGGRRMPWPVRVLPGLAACGLAGLLVHFTQACEEGLSHYRCNRRQRRQITCTEQSSTSSSRARDILRYVTMAMTVTSELKRFEVPKAALDLLSRHAGTRSFRGFIDFAD